MGFREVSNKYNIINSKVENSRMMVIFAIEKIIDARKSPRRKDSTKTTVVLTMEAIVARIFKRVVNLQSPYVAQMRKFFIVLHNETV